MPSIDILDKLRVVKKLLSDTTCWDIDPEVIQEAIDEIEKLRWGRVIDGSLTEIFVKRVLDKFNK